MKTLLVAGRHTAGSVLRYFFTAGTDAIFIKEVHAANPRLDRSLETPVESARRHVCRAGPAHRRVRSQRQADVFAEAIYAAAPGPDPGGHRQRFPATGAGRAVSPGYAHPDHRADVCPGKGNH